MSKIDSIYLLQQLKLRNVRRNADGTYSLVSCTPRDLNKSPYTPAELARQHKFKQAVQSRREILSDPKRRAKYQTLFEQQTRYKSLNDFVMALEFSRL